MDDNNYAGFHLSTEGIKYKNITTGAIEYNSGATLSQLNSIMSLIERTVRNSTNEQGFHINRDRYTVDSKGIASFDIIVEKKFEKLVAESLKYIESRNNKLFGEASNPLTGYMTVEDLVKTVTSKSSIKGSKAMRLALKESSEAGGYAEILPPTAKNSERIRFTDFIPASELAGKTDKEITAIKTQRFNEQHPQTLMASKIEKTKRKIETKKEVEKYFREEEKAKAEAVAKAEQEAIEAQNKERKREESLVSNWIKIEDRDKANKDKEAKKKKKAEEKAKKDALLAQQRQAKADEKEVIKNRIDEKAKEQKLKHVLLMIASGVVAIADITRRILTSVLSNASEVRKRTIEANSLGLSYLDARAYGVKDLSLGLATDTHLGAIEDFQSKFGDISNIDEKALGILARVMGAKVSKMVLSGQGGDNPDVLITDTLNSFFENYKAGKNSFGQNVGREQAERELTTVLKEVSPKLASIFTALVDDYNRGIHAGKFENYSERMNLVKDYKGGLLAGDFDKLHSLGQVTDELKAKFKSLKDDVLAGLGLSIANLVTAINNSEIGMSIGDKLENRTANILANKADNAKAKIGLAMANQQVEKELAKKGYSLSDFKASSAEELYEQLKANDYSDDAINKTTTGIYAPLYQMWARGEGEELANAIIMAGTYGEIYNTTKKRMNTVSGKVFYDSVLLTEGGVSAKSRELANGLSNALTPFKSVENQLALDKYLSTYDMYNADGSINLDKFYAKDNNDPFILSLYKSLGVKNKVDLQSKLSTLSKADRNRILASAYESAQFGNVARSKTEAEMYGSVVDEKLRNLDIKAMMYARGIVTFQERAKDTAKSKLDINLTIKDAKTKQEQKYTFTLDTDLGQTVNKAVEIATNE